MAIGGYRVIEVYSDPGVFIGFMIEQQKTECIWALASRYVFKDRDTAEEVAMMMMVDFDECEQDDPPLNENDIEEGTCFIEEDIDWIPEPLPEEE